MDMNDPFGQSSRGAFGARNPMFDMDQITWSTLVIRKWQCRWIESSAPVSAGVELEVAKEVVIVVGEDNQEEEEEVECTADLDTPPLITGLATSSRLAGMT